MKKVVVYIVMAFVFAGCATQEPPRNCYDKGRLEQKEFVALKNTKAALAIFRSEYTEMSAYIGFLNAFVADYTKYISAASSASAVINYMPIPYAGQISSAANFGAKMTALAGSASRSAATLNASIKEFESRLAQYESSGDSQKLASAHTYASGVLQNDIHKASEDLSKLKEGASVLLSVSKYYSEAGETFSKATSMFKNGDAADKRAQNDKALKTKNDSFDRRLVRTLNSFESVKDGVRHADAIEKLKKEL